MYFFAAEKHGKDKVAYSYLPGRRVGGLAVLLPWDGWSDDKGT